MARMVDKPIAGLLADLKSRGLLEQTLMVWTSEFGRTSHGRSGNGRGIHRLILSVLLSPFASLQGSDAKRHRPQYIGRLFTASAGTACITSQCSAILPFATRKMSTMTISGLSPIFG